MNSHQITDLKLLYEAVYNDELREKAEEFNREYKMKFNLNNV